MNRVVIGIILVCCLAAAPVLAGNPALEKDLQTILDTFLAENSVAPGLSVYIICPSLELDWSGSAGTTAHGDSTPLTAGHTFRIASNTKTYTAAALLRLVEMGRLTLDDPLSRYLADSHNKLLQDDGYDTDAITIAQVLSHTAGLNDHTNDPRFVERILADPQYKWTVDEKIQLLVEWFDPLGEPGGEFAYSDTGYIILGTIIERLTGRELGPAVRELLDYDRLGLTVTHWEYMEDTPAQAGPRAHQYYGEIDVTSYYASFDLYGGGGIVTDARELALFMRQLLKGRVFEKETTLKAMTSGGTEPYRLGLMVMKCGELEAIGHQGFWNTFAYHLPSHDLTISGSILNHESTNGFELMCRLAGAVAAAKDKRPE